MSYHGYNEILVEKSQKLLIIKFSNPRKKNAINRNGYRELTRVLTEVANDPSVTMVVVTGVGEYFTAGNDLSIKEEITDMDKHLNEASVVFENMVKAYMDCPKIIVALVNGPCIGIGATLSGLSDLVWCSETAYFLTPFTQLGIVPEAGSSYLFPLIMGRSKASEMLLFSEKMSAEEALAFNFVSKIYKKSELQSIWAKIHEFSELPPESLLASKKLLRLPEKEAMHRALQAECQELAKRFRSEEFFNALMAFSMRKKSKL